MQENNQTPIKNSNAVGWPQTSSVTITRAIVTNSSERTNDIHQNPKITTKISKLIYEPKSHAPSCAQIKTINTFCNKTDLQKPQNESQLDNKKKNFTFKIRDMNKCQDESNDKVKTTNRNEEDDEEIGDKTSRSNKNEEEFLKKKLEREKDIEDIQKMLNQINTSCHKDNKNDVVDLQKVSPIKFFPCESHPIENLKRTQTDTNLKVTNFSFSSTKTFTNTTLRSKSSSNLSLHNPTKLTIETPKKKSYDPNEARLFMKKQRMNRKAQQQNNDATGAVGMPSNSTTTYNAKSKEEIKQRLENLRKETIKILEKNVKTAQKRSAQIVKQQEKTAVSPSKSRKIENDNEVKISNSISSLKSNNILTPLNSRRTLTNSSQIDMKDILNEKIGLLRKPETEDHSFSAIKDFNINKENINLDLITPTLSQTKIPDEAFRKISDTVFCKKIPSENIYKSSIENSNSFTKIAQKPLNKEQNELELKIPPHKLQSKISLCEKSVQVDNVSSQNDENKIPYWLKPTPVQIYPYNFIMAVRKKLEAITNPVITDKRKNQQHKKHELSKHHETPLSNPKYRKETVRRRIADDRNIIFTSTDDNLIHKNQANTLANLPDDLIKKNPSIKTNLLIDKNVDKVDHPSKSISEITSNFSSISIHVPESNTISEISSIRSETGLTDNKIKKLQSQKTLLSSTKKSNEKGLKLANNDDDTTISSSIFSSPEKKVHNQNKNIANLEMNELTDVDGSLSPLETDKIKNLQIKSKSNMNLQFPQLQLTPSSTSKQDSEKSIKLQNNSEHFNASRFLEDFNKSLSQVIQVNQQLKVPDKMQQLLSPNSNIPSKNIKKLISNQSKTDEYTSDFEEDLSKTISSIKGLNKTSGNANNSSTVNISELKLNLTKSSNSENIKTLSNLNTINENYSNILTVPSNQKSSVHGQENSLSLLSENSQSQSQLKSESISEKIVIVDNEILTENDKSVDNNANDHKEFIQNHINNSRGDFIDTNNEIKLISNSDRTKQSIESNVGPPPAYVLPENVHSFKENTSISSELIAVINRSDIELSMISQNESASASETTLSYSSIGMYEQLLQSETSKSEQLGILLKMREKALMDRTRGQIAWLEVQKEKYRSKGGSTAQISIIKKKQRAILMKMEKKREEIKKLIQSQQAATTPSNASTDRQQKFRSYRPKLIENLSDIELRTSIITSSTNRNKNLTTTSSTTKLTNIVRGFEVNSSRNLEIILKKREEELIKRRADVKRLMEWHKRLDKEEEEVLQLEKMLFDQQHNKSIVQQQTFKHSAELKKEKKLFEINKSLKQLEGISSLNCENQQNQQADYVRINGYKLNKLWRRLTGQKTLQKFDELKKYKLYKSDLEKLYEEAKEEVLRDFDSHQEIMELFDQSKFDQTSASSLCGDSNNQSENIVPRINLNFSSGQSDIERTTNNFTSVFFESTITQKKNSNQNIETSNSNSANATLTEILLDENEIGIDNGQMEILNESLNSNESTENEMENITISEKIINNLNKETPNDIEINSISSNIVETTGKDSEQINPSTKQTEISEIQESQTSEDVNSLITETNTKSVDENINNLNSTENISEKISINNISLDEIKEVVNLNQSISSESIEFVKSQENTTRSSVIVTLTKQESGNTETIQELVDSKSQIQFDINEIKLINENENETQLKNDENSTNEIKEQLTDDKTVSSKALLIDIESIKVGNSISSDEIEDNEIVNIQNNLSSQTNSEILTENELNIKSSSQDYTNVSFETFESSTNSNTSTNNLETPPSKISNETFILTVNTLASSSSIINNQSEKIEEVEEENEEYENDFSDSETFIDDITLPKFDITLNDSKPDDNDNNLINSTTDLEKRLIDLDVSLKDLHNTFDRALSPEKSLIISPKSPLLSPPKAATLVIKSPISLNDQNDILDMEKNKFYLSPRNYITNNEKTTTTLMPDIISEVEIRRQQILIENEIKQLEKTVQPYVYLREIPNKPPPPYVPPAHGSPMTIIFPSEERIEEITFRRTKELYNEILKTDNKTVDTTSSTITATTTTTTPTPQSPTSSILDENITNIYERIILDICKECMEEYKETLIDLNPETYKNSLALFNPPDRLKCMQNFVYQYVRKFLGMEKKTNNNLIKNSVFSIGRRKRDQVDEILIQELFEEEHKWINFDKEEDEVKLAIVDEIFNDIIRNVVDEIVEKNDMKIDLSVNCNVQDT